MKCYKGSWINNLILFHAIYSQFYCLPDNYEVIDASLNDITVCFWGLHDKVRFCWLALACEPIRDFIEYKLEGACLLPKQRPA